jgi:hypothetical protein
MAKDKVKITARKYMGDDRYSWAVFVDGRVVVAGISKTQVPYYKKLAAEKLAEKASQKD